MFPGGSKRDKAGEGDDLSKPNYRAVHELSTSVIQKNVRLNFILKRRLQKLAQEARERVVEREQEHGGGAGASGSQEAKEAIGDEVGSVGAGGEAVTSTSTVTSSSVPQEAHGAEDGRETANDAAR